MRGAIRLSALSHLQTIWLMTHDSIGLGEDGPTHQPVEHLAALRAIPNLSVIRPADANETREAWMAAIRCRTDGPTLIALTRQALPVIDRSQYPTANGLHKGAYVLKDFGQDRPQIILIASGSEVSLILAAAVPKEEVNQCSHGVDAKLDLFLKQSAEYRELVFSKAIRKRIAVEMAGLAWDGRNGWGMKEKSLVLKNLEPQPRIK